MATEKMHEKASYQRGYRAYGNGLARTDCPYRFNTIESYEWTFGWDDAQDFSTKYRVQA